MKEATEATGEPTSSVASSSLWDDEDFDNLWMHLEEESEEDDCNA